MTRLIAQRLDGEFCFWVDGVVVGPKDQLTEDFKQALTKPTRAYHCENLDGRRARMVTDLPPGDWRHAATVFDDMGMMVISAANVGAEG